MSKGMLAAAVFGLAAATLSGFPGEARAQHWFYGNYGAYDGAVYYPQPRRQRPSYYPAYPRPWFWRGHPREVVEYEVAPGEWIRVYPDGRQVPLTKKRRKLADPNRAAKTRQAARPAVKDAVPLPKAKPANSAAQTAMTATTTTTTGSELESAAVALELPELPEAEAAPPTRQIDPLETGSLESQGSLRAVSCEEAERIVSEFGFSGAKATGCAGRTYEVEAMRDGQPYTIKLSAADGELTEVKKR